MKRLTAVLGMSLAIVSWGCITTAGRIMRSWEGKTSDELISKWGAPDSSASLDDGSRVLTWITVSGDESGVNTCRQSFTINSEDVVSRWSYSGCGPLVVRLPW